MKKKPLFDDNIVVTVNPNIKVHPNPFPKKMESAIAFFEKNGLPPEIKQTKNRKKPPLSALQAELLTVYSINPTEQQMHQLKKMEEEITV
jgi:hypothetical protein